MENKRILRWSIASLLVMVLWAYIAGVGIAAATEIYNQTFYFIGGGTLAETIASPTGLTGVSTTESPGVILHLKNDFSDSKYISNMTFGNTIGAPDYSGNPHSYTLSLGTSNAGINQKYVSFTATVLGNDFASGYIGWVRTTGNNYNYKIVYTSINSATAAGLTGKQEIVFSYDHSVYAGITTSSAQALTGTEPSYNYELLQVSGVFDTGVSVRRQNYVIGSQNLHFSFSTVFNERFDNLTGQGFGVYNASKYNYNYTVLLTNFSETGELYNFTSTTDITNLILDITQGLITHIYSLDGGYWTNHTIYDGSGNFVFGQGTTGEGTGGSPSGQIYFDISGNLFGFNVSLLPENYAFTTTYYIYAGFPDTYDHLTASWSGTQTYSTGRVWNFSTIGRYKGILKYCDTYDLTCSNLFKINLHVLDTATYDYGGIGGIPPNPTTGKAILFDQKSYTIGQTANITWAISDSVWNTFITNTISIRKNSDQDPNHFTSLISVAPKSGTVQYTFSPAGNCFVCGTGAYEVVLYRNVFGLFETERQTDLANVFEPTAYIDAPITIVEGQTINVGWKFGIVTNKGYIIDDKLDEFGVSTFTPKWYNLSCPCNVNPNSTSITFSGVGKHRLSLFDAQAIKNVAQITVNVIPGNAPIGQNITQNYFAIDGSVYDFGDTIYGQYQVSDTNWSTYPFIRISLTSAAGLPMTPNIITISSQTGSFEIPIEATQLNWIQSGSAFVNLTFYPDTFSQNFTVAASIPITINLNKNGYNILVNKKEVCNNDVFSVKYTSPTGIGIIRISYYTNNNVMKSSNYSFNTNGTKQFSIPDGHLNAGVAIDLLDTNGVYQIGTLIKIVDTNCQVVGVTPTPPGQITEETAQTDITNLLTSNIFWAFVVVTGMVVVTAIQTSKNNSNPVLPSTIIGFLGISAFTLIGWIPSWIVFTLVMIVLVIFAWQRAKDINTAGD